MTNEDFGACVVAIPEDTDLPTQVEGGTHITLAYLGDTALDNENAKELLMIVKDLAASYGGPIISDVDNLDYFGDDEDAIVLTMDDTETGVFSQMREQLLDRFDDSLMRIFDEAETFPDYRPHMTLGYTSEGYELPEDIQIPQSIAIRAFALWNGESRFEFEIDRTSMMHIGILRKSGRYPWGSGANPHQRNKAFLDYVADLQAKGLSEAEIARGVGITTTQLRAAKAIAKTAKRQADASEAMRLKDKGMSNVAIGDRMGINESSVRALLNPAMKERRDILDTTASMLKDQVSEKGMIDIGVGVENHLGLSGTKLKTAVAMLQEEGYEVHNIQVDQLGTGKKTLVKVLAPPGTTYKDIVTDPSQVKSISEYSEDGGRSFLGIEPPKSVPSSRVGVRYAEEGGTEADGVIYLRRGVDDISLGGAQYAQVRIAVDGTHYLKGMAMYSDNLPDGVDMLFNTNKSDTGNKLDAMKSMKDDPDNPFGSVIRQKHFVDSSGNSQLSPINIVGAKDTLGGEEGAWGRWSKTLSSQFLSKQSVPLAASQLDLSLKIKQDEYDEIMSLTNPAVKKKLLDSFADGADSSAVHLKAAGLPRTASHVILPINSLKDSEIYAPNYRNGERVVLIRHPHGGTFEIPELTVNNRNREANGVMKNALDAVGINARVAERLSGADFDGDTVLVIPNNSRKVKTSPQLEGLKDFDPRGQYPLDDSQPRMTSRAKQQQMGDVSNLITDMTIRGATNNELARAVRHSMVVIDAEKHHLNYKQSAIDNNIKDLKKKYQARPDGTAGGASTIVSRASSVQRVDKRKLRSARDGGPVDPKTGKKVYTYTPESYVNKKGKTVTRQDKSTRMAETDDAFSLVSGNGGTPMESVYATHANKLKSLGNEARKSSLAVKPTSYSPSAKKTYAPEVDTLNAKLNVALKNKPLERQAQLLANTTVSAKTRANPDMDAADLKKIKGQALEEARSRTGAKKASVSITPSEWTAIQSGAISNNKLTQILDNTDLDLVKQLATPRTNTVMSTAKMARAKSMLNAGYTQSEIADALGVPATTLNSAIGRE